MAIKEQLSAFFVRNKLLSPSQHGFREGLGTETALCAFVKHIIDALDKGTLISGLFIDFSRAFDYVHHELLLEKIYRCGVRGVPFNLIQSYLSKRHQFAQINDVFRKDPSWVLYFFSFLLMI